MLTPVPVSATERSPPPEPLTLNTAAFAPTDVGLKTTLTVQLAPAGSELPQLWVRPN